MTMSGLRNIVFGLAFSTLAWMTPAAALPIAATQANVPSEATVQTVDYHRGWNGNGYRPYRPYAYRPYRPYRPYAAPYAYRPYRPYYRPYYRPGVQVYVEPRRYYQRSGNAHVEWCLSRYRSYNPRTDTFLAYGGTYKYCRSPYR
jgi:hypothetical protein